MPRIKARPCLSCGAKAKTFKSDDSDGYCYACSADCGREARTGLTRLAARTSWNLANEPVEEAKARARAEARIKKGNR